MGSQQCQCFFYKEIYPGGGGKLIFGGYLLFMVKYEELLILHDIGKKIHWKQITLVSPC